MQRTPHGDRSAECVVRVEATPQALFDFLDDPRRLGSHMDQPSWRTGWSRMSYELDARGGREVGSEIRMNGRVLGLSLGLSEVVTQRSPPGRKVWETRGAPRLVVIGPYTMGFEIRAATEGGSELRLFIRYELGTLKPRILAERLGRWYAAWCVERMAHDARDHFHAVSTTRTPT